MVEKTSSPEEERQSVKQRSQLLTEIQQAEQRFQVTFEQAAVGMAHVGLGGEWLHVNQKLCDIVGYSREELLKITFQDITYPDDLDADLAFMEQLLAGSIPTYSMEKRYLRKDGSIVWIDLTVALARDVEDKPDYMISVVEDISERKRLAEEYQRQQKRLRLLAERAETERQKLYDLFIQAPALICVVQGNQYRFVFANAQYMQIVGRTDLVGKPFRKALPEQEGQLFLTLLEQVYLTGEPFIGKEIRAKLDRLPDGTLRSGYFNFVFQPTYNPEGQIDGVLVHGVNVTEQVQAREEIQRNKKRLELAQRVGHIGTFEWDIPSNEIFWTPELEALYDLPPGGFEGNYENWARRVHPDDLQAAEENLLAASKGGPPYNAEFRVIRPDGTIRWLLGKGEISAYDENGLPTRMVGVNIDVTESKETEMQKALINQELQELNANLEELVNQRTEVLRQVNAELQRSNQELQDFAYVASHDLQEPLRKIQAFGNLLEEEHGKELGEGKSYLDRMRKAAARMQVLINDLLAFSRVTTKAQPFVEVELNEVVSGVLDDLETQIKNTHGTVEVGALPVVEADGLQMRQIFQNLIGNALKFHRREVPPKVIVTAETITGEKSTTDSGSLIEGEKFHQIYVQDNGIGFDEKYLDRIFTVFQRLHGRGDYEGTGIGLAVVRKIVERHGGTVTAKSIIGEGSTFIVTLPVHYSTNKELVSHDE